MGDRRRRRLGPAVVVGLVWIALSCGSIRDDELYCEEAVSRLEECCASFEGARFDCEYARSCNSTQIPDISERAADCIRDKSCGDLEASGTCEALRQIGATPYPANQRTQIDTEACR